MILLDALHVLLNADAEAIGCADSTLCPGSAFTAIAAAYGTQGMWVMADLVDQLLWTSLGSLGPLLYIIAGAGGLVSLALGAPPRTYLWLFLGPAIYRWLIGTSVPAVGVEWQVAGQPVDQRQVWRLAEVGLVNTAMAWKGTRDAGGSRGGSGQIQFFNDAEPSQSIEIPYFYAYYDTVISGTIQALIRWTGVYSQRASTSGDQARTSLPSALPTDTFTDDKWFLLTNLKWGMIQNITDARAQNPYLKVGLSRFFASQCGDKFAESINPTRFLSALYGKGRTAPYSVFNGTQESATFDTLTYDEWLYGVEPTEDAVDGELYPAFSAAMKGTVIPMPRELKLLVQDKSEGGFSQSVNWNGNYDRFINSSTVSCKNYFKMLITAFRWESAQIYHQLVENAPQGLTAKHVVYNLLYGWDVRKTNGSGIREHLSPLQQEAFIRDLILVHLIRNEMAISRGFLAQSSLNPGQLSARVTQDGAEGHLRYIAGKNKSSEFYQWALMIPHMQGILLYYLSIGYPFACLLMILPGMHKTLFTWMSFWAWAKLWDLGFALVMALERSVWAMLGSNSNILKVFNLIANMQNWGYAELSPCPTAGCSYAPVKLNIEPFTGGGYPQFDPSNGEHWASVVRMFDRAIAVGANLDLDLQNSYYIYIMAGLYFAVPVVAGQLVLGGKAGAANLANQVIGGVGQEAGRQGASGYSSDLQSRIKTNFAAGSQSAYQKAMQQSPLYGQALEAGNSARMTGMQGEYLSQQGSLAGNEGNLSSLTSQSADKASGQGYGALKNLGSGAIGGFDAIKAKRANGGWTNPSPPSGSGSGAPGPSGARQLANAGEDVLAGEMGLTAHKLGQQSYDNNASSTIEGAGRSIGQFGQRQRGAEFEASADRMGKQAEYNAQWGAWDAKNAYASSMSATAASLGGLPGGLEPGYAPQDSTGMAMNGELAGNANSAIRFMDSSNPNSGFKQELGSRESNLNDRKDGLNGFYQGYSPGLLFANPGNPINSTYVMNPSARQAPAQQKPLEN